MKPGTGRFTIGARSFHLLAIAALVLLCTIVVTGAAVRLTDSGLGCSDWPRCSPEKFVSVENSNQAVEQVNRLFTGLVSLSVIAAVLGSLRRRPYRRDLVWWSLGLVAGVLGQIVLGGITVLVHLNPIAVAGHFVVSMLLVGDAVVLVKRSGQPDAPRRLVVDTVTLTMSRLTMVAGALLMITGPMVTGTGPHAGDADAARFDFALTEVTRLHSVNMWLFLACALGVTVRLGIVGAPGAVLRRAYGLLAAIVAQGTIGYIQYALEIPAWLVIFHIAGATLVFATALWFHLGLSDPIDGDIEPSAPPKADRAADHVTSTA